MKPHAWIFSLLTVATVSAQATKVSPGELYKLAAPSVVQLEMYENGSKPAKSGTGFIVSTDGKILTNFHVIEHSKRATVRLTNGDAYDTVDVLDIDRRRDIALVKIKAVDLPMLKLGKSATCEVGEGVLVISNPLGVFKNTISEGLISAIRPLDGTRLFQISAAISQGSSGAPVFNQRGEVIAIAVSTVELGQNLNFAIPIDYARGMLQATTSQSLMSIYEPTPAEEPAESAKPAESVKPPSATTPVTASAPQQPTSAPNWEELKKVNMLYLEQKLNYWTLADAKAVLGAPLRDRPSIDAATNRPNGTTYSFPDPARTMNQYELSFHITNGRLFGVNAWPISLSFKDAKKTWGDDYQLIIDKGDRKVYAYRKRRLVMMVKDGKTVESYSVF